DIEQVMQGYERATELVPLLGDLGWDAKRSFNGLMSITADGMPLVGESPEVGGLWLAEAVWVKDAPGIGKVFADWLVKGRTDWDPFSIDIARFYAVQKTPAYVLGRCTETAKKVYNPPVHPREPYLTGRDLRRGPFWPREQELGGYFMEAAGWERAHGYKANEHLLAKYR
ncbi:PROTEIN: FAD dependent oxidoreductase, partial [mine drainage metagenome]